MTVQASPLFQSDEGDDAPRRSHGTPGDYASGCRCDDCEDAYNLWQFGMQYMKLKQTQRREYRARRRPAHLQAVPEPPLPELSGCRESSVYTVELHRALKEPLCERCTHYLRSFS